MSLTYRHLSLHRWLLLAAFALTAAVYWPGLHGGFLFDDYPNIVDNQGVQPKHTDVATLVNAALSSPSSEFKRPLASLSFALNYLASGLDPYGMKLTNLLIHLLNGLLVFLLARALLRCATEYPSIGMRSQSASKQGFAHEHGLPEEVLTGIEYRIGIVAILITSGWLLLPINLTGVLYVVQRMESMANLFVLLGLLGYVAGRRRMLFALSAAGATSRRIGQEGKSGFSLCVVSLIFATALGLLAKETAVLLPLYALLIEWLLFRFSQRISFTANLPNTSHRIIGLFVSLLILPMLLGLVWLLPDLLKPSTWASRNFNLGTRLLSEARIVSDYVLWTLVPTPGSLSFYHDNFAVSTGLLAPWTTFVGIIFLACIALLAWWLRQRQPLTALGIGFFMSCHLLTGTILPLELIYEHRNYFASFGLLLAVIPLLAAPCISARKDASGAVGTRSNVLLDGLRMPLARYVLLAGLMVCWIVLTALTAYAWGNPLRLAEDLASRAPDSPRAQYELGRTYIIYSHYDPTSPFTRLAYAPLERSAALPDSSILPEQALIFMNSRMGLSLRDAWWDSMIEKLQRHKPGVQDESSLSALTDCMHRDECHLPQDRMTSAYLAALSHPQPSARIMALYGDFAWNILGDRDLGQRMLQEAVAANKTEPAYRITLIRMLSADGRNNDAQKALRDLEALNIGGRLNAELATLRTLPGLH
ncbi:hypothetical protein HDE76_003927 [Rhodanobacter sp. ANJX3]|uniref:hypothetical protein n=1 Tax=Rhodanobacter sp. ANJX3 TaxID=2723083 RepID=UPI0018312D8E|nr:hypothetical protein [Rhodanobacter sp. ANJX3]MBB5360681.1 hypothetical protein [Rhodanobacter sp. ANJX3]